MLRMTVSRRQAQPDLSLSCSHSLIWSVMVGGMWADILLVDIMCMLRNRMIWLAVMPPLKFVLQRYIIIAGLVYLKA